MLLISRSSGSYFTAHPEAVDELVRQWIVVGTPFLGAPGRCYEGVTYGFTVDSDSEAVSLMMPYIRNFVLYSPAFWELYPLSGRWALPPSVAVNFIGGGTRTYVGPDEALGAFSEALTRNNLTVAGESRPWPLYPQIREPAVANVQRWLGARVPRETYVVVGTAKPTPYNATYPAGVASLGEIVGVPPVFEMVDGD
eukprot:tig00000317_g24037.t1